MIEYAGAAAEGRLQDSPLPSGEHGVTQHSATYSGEPDPRDLRARIDWSDEDLLRDCEADYHRTGGPGGQHRNKTATAVRLRHLPSGLTVTATGSRSQVENRRLAVDRLREAIAVHFRVALPERVQWPANVQATNGRLRVSERNPNRHHVVALVLDSLADSAGELKRAADRLELTPSSFVRFLHDHPKAWAEANRLREEFGLPALRPPR